MFLYNSYGKHIAYVFNHSLYAPTGENIGNFVPQFNIFVDLKGQYLGEIVEEQYLIAKLNSPYLNVNVGVSNIAEKIVGMTSPTCQKALSSLGFNKDIVLSA